MVGFWYGLLVGRSGTVGTVGRSVRSVGLEVGRSVGRSDLLVGSVGSVGRSVGRSLRRSVSSGRSVGRSVGSVGSVGRLFSARSVRSVGLYRSVRSGRTALLWSGSARLGPVRSLVRSRSGSDSVPVGSGLVLAPRLSISNLYCGLRLVFDSVRLIIHTLSKTCVSSSDNLLKSLPYPQPSLCSVPYTLHWLSICNTQFHHILSSLFISISTTTSNPSSPGILSLQITPFYHNTCSFLDPST